jgi:L-ascorbate 6-phosphate lactonase
MIHATWGEWFVRDEVEGSTVDGLSVWYLGCMGLIVRSASTTLYLDPYFGDGDPPRIVRMIPVPLDPVDATDCDAVLISHEHIDHMHPPSHGPLVENLGADRYAPSAAYEHSEYDGDALETPDKRSTVQPGDELSIGDLSVHVREARDPDAIEPVSYVIEHDAGTIFHGGDSRPAEAFPAIGREFDVDLGILAVGSVGRIAHDDGPARTRWYNDENQLIDAACDLQLDRLLPGHYDMWKGVGTDSKVVHEHAASRPYPRVIERAQIGDRLDVAEPGIVQPRHLS